MSQANVLRLVHELEYVRLDQQTVMLQLTANTFDVATFEIWGAIARWKARAVSAMVASGEELRRSIRREGIETMWLTSAHYSGVAESGVEVLGVWDNVLSAVKHCRWRCEGVARVTANGVHQRLWPSRSDGVLVARIRCKRR